MNITQASQLKDLENESALLQEQIKNCINMLTHLIEIGQEGTDVKDMLTSVTVTLHSKCNTLGQTLYDIQQLKDLITFTNEQ